MPIYEYQCATCGRVHEILQKMSDQPLSQCPDCAGKLQKRISQCTFHLKGTGWYATDYANSSSASSSSPDQKKEDSASGGSSETQSKTGNDAE
ncbi:MAG: FmdB family zinc ribbon protein [Thermodesulfobacteriota bacterium]